MLTESIESGAEVLTKLPCCDKGLLDRSVADNGAMNQSINGVCFDKNRPAGFGGDECIPLGLIAAWDHRCVHPKPGWGRVIHMLDEVRGIVLKGQEHAGFTSR